MTVLETNKLAASNLRALRRNPYPGRGIIAGLTEAGDCMIQVYWIMGRSDNSRNRVFRFEEDTGRLYTEAANAAEMKEPALVIYNAMRQSGLYHVVSNGSQTDKVIDYLEDENLGSFSLSRALGRRLEHEPDKPNFTQRITAVSLQLSGDPLVMMSILRKSLFGSACDKLTYEMKPAPGFGFYISTYAGDGDPLPSFRGDPQLMPLRGNMKKIAETYWEALNEANRISLAVKFITLRNNRSSVIVINKCGQ